MHHDRDFISISDEDLEEAAGGRRCGTVNIIQTPGFGGFPGGYAGGYAGGIVPPVAPYSPYTPYAPQPYSPYGTGMPYSPYGGGGYGFPGYGMRLGTAL
jgi:hypothetical protein